MDLVWSLLLLLRPWMGYDYTVIQNVCRVELLEQRRPYPIFVKIRIPINGTQQCGIGSPEIHKNSAGRLVVNGTLGFGASHVNFDICIMLYVSCICEALQVVISVIYFPLSYKLSTGVSSV